MKYCTNCGSKLDENVHFCGNCGKKIMPDEQPEEGYVDASLYDDERLKKFHLRWGMATILILIICLLIFWKKGPSGTYYDERDGDSYIFEDGYISYSSIYAGWSDGGEPYTYSFGTIYGRDSRGEKFEMAKYSIFLDQVEMEGVTLKKYKN